MRYRLPEDCAGVAHGGVIIDRAPDGTIEAEAGALVALAPHGIVPVGDEAGVKASSRSRADDKRMLR